MPERRERKFNRPGKRVAKTRFEWGRVRDDLIQLGKEMGKDGENEDSEEIYSLLFALIARLNNPHNAKKEAFEMELTEREEQWIKDARSYVKANFEEERRKSYKSSIFNIG